MMVAHAKLKSVCHKQQDIEKPQIPCGKLTVGKENVKSLTSRTVTLGKEPGK
jgi:hypothetical protein